MSDASIAMIDKLREFETLDATLELEAEIAAHAAITETMHQLGICQLEMELRN
jgi:hypothetical protein